MYINVGLLVPLANSSFAVNINMCVFVANFTRM